LRSVAGISADFKGKNEERKTKRGKRKSRNEKRIRRRKQEKGIDKRR